jgi:hypothetical protein
MALPYIASAVVSLASALVFGLYAGKPRIVAVKGQTQ